MAKVHCFIQKFKRISMSKHSTSYRRGTETFRYDGYRQQQSKGCLNEIIEDILKFLSKNIFYTKIQNICDLTQNFFSCR
ncbi:hypothetical protein X975_06737, partial [Stegodyphus mimosarum]